jgi:hypothetical protein
MKKTIMTFTILLFTSIATWAQSPNLFNYQGVARNSMGVPLAGTTISLRISIHDLSATGAIVYREVQHPLTNAFGLFNIAIGDPAKATVDIGSFNGVSWGDGDKYMEVEIDPAGGATWTDLGTTQLLSVPFALVAGNGGWSDYMLAEEREPIGTGGGSSVAGFQTRKLDTVVASSGNAIIFNPGTNSITLNQAGIYYVKASAPAEMANNHQLFIRDLTLTSTYYIVGTVMFANAASDVYNCAEAEGFITVTTPITFILSHHIQTALAGSGLGDNGTAGISNVFSKVLVQKIK